jgi:hypothetical protein
MWNGFWSGLILQLLCRNIKWAHNIVGMGVAGFLETNFGGRCNDVLDNIQNLEHPMRQTQKKGRRFIGSLPTEISGSLGLH